MWDPAVSLPSHTHDLILTPSAYTSRASLRPPCDPKKKGAKPNSQTSQRRRNSKKKERGEREIGASLHRRPTSPSLHLRYRSGHLARSLDPPHLLSLPWPIASPPLSLQWPIASPLSSPTGHSPPRARSTDASAGSLFSPRSSLSLSPKLNSTRHDPFHPLGLDPASLLRPGPTPRPPPSLHRPSLPPHTLEQTRPVTNEFDPLTSTQPVRT